MDLNDLETRINIVEASGYEEIEPDLWAPPERDTFWTIQDIDDLSEEQFKRKIFIKIIFFRIVKSDRLNYSRIRVN